MRQYRRILIFIFVVFSLFLFGCKEKVFDCRGVDLKKALLSKCTAQMTKTFGEYLGSIII